MDSNGHFCSLNLKSHVAHSEGAGKGNKNNWGLEPLPNGVQSGSGLKGVALQSHQTGSQVLRPTLQEWGVADQWQKGSSVTHTGHTPA